MFSLQPPRHIPTLCLRRLEFFGSDSICSLISIRFRRPLAKHPQYFEPRLELRPDGLHFVVTRLSPNEGTEVVFRKAGRMS